MGATRAGRLRKFTGTGNAHRFIANSLPRSSARTLSVLDAFLRGVGILRTFHAVFDLRTKSLHSLPLPRISLSAFSRWCIAPFPSAVYARDASLVGGRTRFLLPSSLSRAHTVITAFPLAHRIRDTHGAPAELFITSFVALFFSGRDIWANCISFSFTNRVAFSDAWCDSGTALTLVHHSWNKWAQISFMLWRISRPFASFAMSIRLLPFTLLTGRFTVLVVAGRCIHSHFCVRHVPFHAACSWNSWAVAWAYAHLGAGRRCDSVLTRVYDASRHSLLR